LNLSWPSTTFGSSSKSAPGSYSGPIVWNAPAPTDLYYSSQWQVLEEDNLTPTGTAAYAQYVWGLAYVDEMVLRDRNDGNSGGNYGISNSGLDERFYVLQDANWNTVGIVEPGSTLATENFIYDPYGNVTVLNAATTGAISDNYNWVYLHQGGRLDPATGLYNHRRRDYGAGLGRWYEQDPARFRDGLNLYQYVGSNPIARVDPTGLVQAPYPFVPGRGVILADLGYNDDYSSAFSIRFVPNASVKCNCTLISFAQYY
jgi:RHS repeat-associated protein